jgi:hypothetical protein
VTGTGFDPVDTTVGVDTDDVAQRFFTVQGPVRVLVQSRVSQYGVRVAEFRCDIDTGREDVGPGYQSGDYHLLQCDIHIATDTRAFRGGHSRHQCPLCCADAPAVKMAFEQSRRHVTTEHIDDFGVSRRRCVVHRLDPAVPNHDGNAPQNVAAPYVNDVHVGHREVRLR